MLARRPTGHGGGPASGFRTLAACGLACLVALAMSACGGRAPVPVGPPPAQGPIPSFDHIYLLVLENREASAILGDPSAPYLNDLARRSGLARRYTAVAHPSLPNYLALWSGSTHGIDGDGEADLTARTLADQIEAAGRTWKVFAENVRLTGPAGRPSCFTGSDSTGGPDGTGTYARKHEPAISFTSVSRNPKRCIDHVTDFSHFDPAAADFELIIPNLCNDMHSCETAHGDAWLASWLPEHLLRTATWRDTTSVLFITWDEGTSTEHEGGNVATLVVSPGTPSGVVSDTPHTHYSLLRTIEAAWQLPCLGESCRSNDLAEFFPTRDPVAVQRGRSALATGHVSSPRVGTGRVAPQAGVRATVKRTSRP